ncbi:uncharacterized protein [Neodiprion pinetum]|uniref:uncharacterized protein isoform X1 n=1 Tax=Neodiprion pinetum TaxID=441929 RepID=UPI001EDE595E|nr:uncharacterized protein LOC124213754 isoform X1 [Neodiprion pinetum]
MKLLILILTVAAAAEDSKWIWGDEEKARAGDNRNIRYNVHEYPDNSDGGFASQNQFRPQYPGPYGPNSRPIRPGDGNQVLVGPDGPSGIIGRAQRFLIELFSDLLFRPGNNRPFRPGGDGFDHNSGPVVPGVNVDPILSGPVPSWIRNDPRYQEFDTCKCSRGFNCPGVKFGSCSRGKQYCCFSSRKYGGTGNGYQQFNGNYPNRPQYPGNLPFRPFNAIPPEYYENGNNYGGDYDGDYYGQYQNGGYDRPYNNYNRPYNNYGNGPDGYYDRPYRGPYAPGYAGNNNPYFNWQNPYNRPRPYDFDDYGRLAGKSKSKNDKTANDVPTSPSTDGETSKDN